MLKLNKPPKLFNSLALVAALTISTVVYAMESEEDPKVAGSKLSPIVINEELMQEARRITRKKVLKNLHAFSNNYFNTNEYMTCYDPLDKSKKFSIKFDKVQHERNISWFNENSLTQPEFIPTLNKDIIALLKEGINPNYLDSASTFDGVAEALTAKGITLDSLLGRESTFADSAETLEETDITTDSLADETHRRHRPCNIS